MRTRTALLTLLALLPSTAAMGAGGYPIGGVAGPSGVVTMSSAGRYVTIDSGGNTVLERIQRAGGQVSAWRTLHGRFGVPAIAMDGTAGGLSGDGGTLVLTKPQNRFPVSRTPLAIVATRTLHVRKLSLKGTFAFDALSPDGRSIYLTQYPSRDATRYVVRRFDVTAMRLAPGAIVDRRKPGEEMRGSPLTRASSSDGRWAYTLYDGAGSTPFVHALDTGGRRAFCIDLDALRGSPQLYNLRLQLNGGGLRVMDRDEAVATVDTTTFRVTDGVSPAVQARPVPGGTGDTSHSSTWPLALGAGLAVALGIGALRVARRRRAVASR